jgi:cysteine-rich repeat protein
VKASFSGGCLLGAVAALVFAACSSPHSQFSSPGLMGAGQAGTVGVAGSLAAHAGAGASAGEVSGGGSPGDLGTAGQLSAGGARHTGGASGTAGSGGRADSGSVAGSGGRASAGSGGGAGSGGNPDSGGGLSNAGSGGRAGNGGDGGSGTAGEPNQTAVCGNHVLESGEQCDDGNTLNLDACNSACQFEQSQRSNWFKVQATPDLFCTANAFGKALGSLAGGVLQSTVDDRVAKGALSLLFAFRGLADLTGQNAGAVSLGVLFGTPRPDLGYDGTSDLDWWYAPLASTIDGARSPVSTLEASISAGLLSTSPGKIRLPLLSAVPLAFSSARLRLPLGASSKPLLSTGSPPGHLASEQLDPAQVSFASGGLPTAAGAGELCGNISAASLNAELLPAGFIAGGATPCAEGYGATSTLLDALLSGCTFLGGLVVALTPTQPDQMDLSLPQPGGGGPYQLSAGAAHAVNTCRDKAGTVVPLATCLDAAAYSSAYKLTTDRVIIK